MRRRSRVRALDRQGDRQLSPRPEGDRRPRRSRPPPSRGLATATSAAASTSRAAGGSASIRKDSDSPSAELSTSARVAARSPRSPRHPVDQSVGQVGRRLQALVQALQAAAEMSCGALAGLRRRPRPPPRSRRPETAGSRRCRRTSGRRPAIPETRRPRSLGRRAATASTASHGSSRTRRSSATPRARAARRRLREPRPPAAAEGPPWRAGHRADPSSHRPERQGLPGPRITELRVSRGTTFQPAGHGLVGFRVLLLGCPQGRGHLRQPGRSLRGLAGPGRQHRIPIGVQRAPDPSRHPGLVGAERSAPARRDPAPSGPPWSACRPRQSSCGRPAGDAFTAPPASGTRRRSRRAASPAPSGPPRPRSSPLPAPPEPDLPHCGSAGCRGSARP